MTGGLMKLKRDWRIAAICFGLAALFSVSLLLKGWKVGWGIVAALIAGGIFFLLRRPKRS
jgi:hypothetical protein